MKYSVPIYRCMLVRDGEKEVARERAPSFDDAAEIFFESLKNLPVEEVHVLFVDGQNRVTGLECVSRGGLHGCALSCRDVLRGAIAANASAIIVGHNHPSGDPRASADDIAMTKSLAAACEVVGVPLLDHIIVCPESRRATSLLEAMGSW